MIALIFYLYSVIGIIITYNDDEIYLRYYNYSTILVYIKSIYLWPILIFNKIKIFVDKKRNV